ncbi:hypothetical protein NQ315_005715 [Exocentrus adspersus]|uniref:DDE Tnp4 domain-containing protein n=1 Tax=Exocentrus adspersus TaxID=1586481 RepID=A0AAV8VIK3_9CUCU|nr:hypothetical protein NQ315_005715 [Exocentrus adspersus]
MVLDDLEEIEGDVNNENAEEPAENAVADYRSPLQTLSESQFMRRYRLSKQLTRDLINILTPHVVPPSRTSAMTIERKVLTALRFYSTGSYQGITGCDKNISVSQPTVSRCVREISLALNNPEIFNQWVHFPRNIDELSELRHRPTGDPEFPEHAYVNRKMYHSINVQLICDVDMKILNVNARFPGSVHDARIWNQSNVSRTMENLYRRDPNNVFSLLGDSGYPLRLWHITPFLNPLPGSPEERFNNAQTSIRSIIERCNGLLKNRFRCLIKDRVLHYRPEIASLIINTCVVLHNMCITNNIELLLDHDEEEILDDGIMHDFNPPPLAHVGGNVDLEGGRALRNHIANNYFA